MKNVNAAFAAALVCLLALLGFEHHRVSSIQSGKSAPAHLFGAAVNPSVPPMLHASSHISTGTDAISDATTTQDGLESAATALLLAQWQAGPTKFTFDNEEFKAGGTSAGASTIAANATTLLTGTVNWRAFASGTASRIDLTTAGQTAAHAGIVRIDTGTATTGLAALVRGAGSTPNTTLGSGQSFHQKWWTMWTTLSDGTNTFQSTLGWTQGAAAPTDGCFANYSSAAPASGQIICQMCNTSTCAQGTGGTPPTVVGGTWYHVNVDWDGTNCSCAVDGVNIGSTSSNVPAAQLVSGVVIVKSAGATARNEDVDYYSELEIVAAGR